MRRSPLVLSLGLVAALIVVAILLAASVERVTFTSGRPFDEDISRGPIRVGDGGRPAAPLRPADLAIAYGTVGSIAVLVVLLLRRNAAGTGLPRRRHRRAWDLIVLATIVASISAVLVSQMNPVDKAGDVATEEAAAASSTADQKAGPAKYQTVDELMGTGGEDTGRSAGPSFILVTTILALVSFGVCVSLIIQLLRRKSHAPADDRADEILAPVRAAVAELRLGRDARGAVEQCYRQMLHALAERSKVDPACLTPREFVAALASVGLDGTAIGELSVLFEEVHYGHRPEESLAARALQCMTAITESYPAPEAAA